MPSGRVLVLNLLRWGDEVKPLMCVQTEIGEVDLYGANGQAKRQLKLTSVVVTHDLASAYKVGHRIAMLHDGVVIHTGTPDEIRNTKTAVVKGFVEGKPELVESATSQS